MMARGRLATNILTTTTQLYCRGMFQHKGFVLKPVQASPRGPREVSFYRGLTGSTSQDDLKMLEITARFYGVETVRMTGGEMCEFLVLGNNRSSI